MSSDFVVDSEDRSKPRFAIQVKSRSAFQDSRTVEKLQIERIYWAEKEVPFFLVNENQIPRPVFESIGVLYNHIEDDASQDELLTYAFAWTPLMISIQGKPYFNSNDYWHSASFILTSQSHSLSYVAQI